MSWFINIVVNHWCCSATHCYNAVCCVYTFFHKIDPENWMYFRTWCKNKSCHRYLLLVLECHWMLMPCSVYQGNIFVSYWLSHTRKWKPENFEHCEILGFVWRWASCPEVALRQVAVSLYWADLIGCYLHMLCTNRNGTGWFGMVISDNIHHTPTICVYPPKCHF